METKDSNKSSFARVRVEDSQRSESPVLSSRQYLKLLASHTYHLYMTPVDMRKSFKVRKLDGRYYLRIPVSTIIIILEAVCRF